MAFHFADHQLTAGGAQHCGRQHLKSVIDEVVFLLPFYQAWSELLAKSTMDEVSEDRARQPCKSVERVQIILAFYDAWFHRPSNR